MAWVVMSNPTTTSDQAPALKSSAWAMALFGYRSKAAFWTFVRTAGVPCVRLNARVIRFDQGAVESWIASRSTAATSRAA